MNYNHAFGQGRRTKRVLAVSVTAALALTGVALVAVPSNAAVAPTTATPDLSKAASWAAEGITPSNFDFAATKLPGKSTPAFRLSNWVSDPALYGAVEQFETPAVAAAGPRGTSDASYDTFQETFTLSAASYATQPDLAIEVSPDRHGTRAGGDLVLREEAGQKLTLTNFHLKPGATSDDDSDWAPSTASVDFTKPVTIKYVAQFNPDASADVVKVYVNGSKTPLITGSTFETYHAIEGNPAQSVDALNFRAYERQVLVGSDEAAWTTQQPTPDELTALKGKGFYISGLSYGVSNSAPNTPIEFAVPTIAGTAAVGQTLTAGTDTDEISNVNFTYQWLRNGKTISKATASTYGLGTSDYGQKISVKVTASKPGYTSSTRTSASTATVAKGTFVVSSPMTVVGTAAVGSKLTAHVATTPSGAYYYQWLRDGKAIKGATATTYTPVFGDLGATISASASILKTDFTTVTPRSEETAAVVVGTLSIGTPTLSGTTKVGQTLSAKVTATSGALLRYSFYNGDQLLQLSTSPKLLLTWDLVGAHITVVVSGVAQGYTPFTSATSIASAEVK
jgi:hypothetical protein